MLIGTGLLVLFIASTQAGDKANSDLLLAGLACFGFGAFLKWRSPKRPHAPSNRFRVLRRRKNDTQPDGDND
jgi:hypothetical protein